MELPRFAVVIVALGTFLLTFALLILDSQTRLKRFPWAWAAFACPYTSLCVVGGIATYLPIGMQWALTTFDRPDLPHLLHVLIRGTVTVAAVVIAAVFSYGMADLVAIAHRRVEQPTKSAPFMWRALRGVGALLVPGGIAVFFIDIAQGEQSLVARMWAICMLAGILVFAIGQLGICLTRKIDVSGVLAYCFQGDAGGHTFNECRDIIRRVLRDGASSPGVYEQVVAAIGDPPTASVLAIETLGEYFGPRGLPAVPMLIPLLADRTPYRYRLVTSAAREALGKITGQDFEYNTEQWQKWWEEHKEGWEKSGART